MRAATIAEMTRAMRSDDQLATIPGKGWFVYFRSYGPDAPTFDGSWKAGDFERVK